jgi:hypothetical protein
MPSVLAGKPVAGRVRCENLVDEDDLAVHLAEFKLGVCEDQPLRLGVLCAPPVDLQR